jgi:hypothetical protein
VRVEWARSDARADRWEEDIIFIMEEMRRILRFSDWKAEWWVEQGGARSNISDELREGLTAYAAKQESILRILAMTFADEWYPELARSGLVPSDWPVRYLESHSTSTPTPHEPVVVNDADLEYDFDFID